MKKIILALFQVIVAFTSVSAFGDPVHGYSFNCKPSSNAPGLPAGTYELVGSPQPGAIQRLVLVGKPTAGIYQTVIFPTSSEERGTYQVSSDELSLVDAETGITHVTLYKSCESTLDLVEVVRDGVVSLLVHKS